MWLQNRLPVVAVVAFLASLLLASSVEVRGQAPRRVPSRIPSDAGDWDLWVSSAELGDLRSRSANSERRLRFADWLFKEARSRQRAARCVEHYVSSALTQDIASYEDLVTKALAVLRGTVTAVEPGLLDGTPGLLVELDVSEWIKTSEAYGVGRSAYVFYRPPEVRVAGVRICQPQTGWPEPPEVGSSILLFPRRRPHTFVDAKPFVSLGGLGLLFDSGAGLQANRHLADLVPALSQPITLTDLAERARHFLTR